MVYLKGQYLVHSLTSEKTTIATFADDTAILATSTSQEEAIKHLQTFLNKVCEWIRRWKIKINENTCVHDVTYTLRKINLHFITYVNVIPIPQAEITKYLGLHLDSRVNLKHHIRQKLNRFEKN